MEKYPAAEAFAEVLNANGVDNIFFNPGVDTVPLQVAIAKLNARGKTVEDPAELAPVLKEALAQARGGRLAVVDVWLQR